MDCKHDYKCEKGCTRDCLNSKEDCKDCKDC